MNECDRCGSEVSDQYWRVFAVDGALHGCLHCQKKSGQHAPTGTHSRTRVAE
ncbi:MAG: hypothetical protein ABEH61_00605 [Haloarculaceae archaeon]